MTQTRIYDTQTQYSIFEVNSQSINKLRTKIHNNQANKMKQIFTQNNENHRFLFVRVNRI